MTAEVSDPLPPADIPRFSLRTLFVVMIAVAVIFGIKSMLSRIAIPEHVAMSIEEGMTREEVRAVAGQPHRIEGRGNNRYYAYNYWSTSGIGSVYVQFDNEDRVFSVSF